MWWSMLKAQVTQFYVKSPVCVLCISEFSAGQLITSLCPILGETHAQIFHGMCPRNAQSLQGKELKVSFIGPEPFVTYNPVGGSDFLVIKLLAKKFGFFPQFVPEISMDVVKSNGTSYGMVYKVGETYLFITTFLFQYHF